MLPEQHAHKIVPVEHRELQHGSPEAIKARLEQERLQFQNTRTEAGTKETHSVAPVIAGEHVHHHVHEVGNPLYFPLTSADFMDLDYSTNCQ